jgi:hypothetical protein
VCVPGRGARVGYTYRAHTGLRHSAFTLANESLLAKSAINGADVLPGALVALLQKGLQYIDVEWHLTEDGVEVECDATPSLLTALKGRPADAGPPVPKAKDAAAKRRTADGGKERKEKRPKSEDGAGAGASAGAGAAVAGVATGSGPMAVDAENDEDATLNLVPSSEVTILRGHESEVRACRHLAWPGWAGQANRPGGGGGGGGNGRCRSVHGIPSSRSSRQRTCARAVTPVPGLTRRPVGAHAGCRAGDAMALLWQLPDGPISANSGNAPSAHVVMVHPFATVGSHGNKDVTSLDWSVRPAPRRTAPALRRTY